MRRTFLPFSWAEPLGLFQRSGGKWGNTPPVTTDFVRKAAALKRRHRGRGQYDFARREAEQFLETEVPQTATSVWMEKGANALALAQLLSFFEIQPDPALSALVSGKLTRFLDDQHCDHSTRLLSAISLMAMQDRNEHSIERAFAAVEQILQESSKSGEVGNSEMWSMIEHAAKVLQRGGKRSPSVLNESLASIVMTQLERTAPGELAHMQFSLLRIYGWMVRIGKPVEANRLLVTLVEHTGEFRSFEFATLINSCLRHHQLCPLPVPLLHRMARVALSYSTTANGRDVALLLASMAKMLISLESGKNGVTHRDVSELGGMMSALLEEYEPRVLRFFDRNDKLHWTHCDDVTSIAFAYEMGGRQRFSHVFKAFQLYVAHHVSRFEPPHLAMASGILRRAELLSSDLAIKLGERIETVLGEFSLAEISHICATFAPMSPHWMQEAKAVASRLLVLDCSNYTKLTLAMTFPDDEALHAQIDFKEITARQLVDAASLAKGTKFEEPVVAELNTRLHAVQGSFTPDDLRALQLMGRSDIQSAVSVFLASRFAEAEWTADTLYSLPLANAIPSARDPRKALEAAKAISVSPEQFVSLVELLASVFGESDAAMTAFIATGGTDLLNSPRILWTTLVRYLAAVRPFKTLHPNAEWLALLNEKVAHRVNKLKPSGLLNFLVSLQAIYSNVSQHPLLQLCLTEIVNGPYQSLTLPPDAETAQITVLLAVLQSGMPRPLITESTPMLAAVRVHADVYPPELREAVRKIALSQEVEVKRVGRFTLRATQALDKAAPVIPQQQQPQDVNAALDMDPFAATTPMTHEPPPNTPLTQGVEHTQSPAETKAKIGTISEHPEVMEQAKPSSNTSHYMKFFASPTATASTQEQSSTQVTAPTPPPFAAQEPSQQQSQQHQEQQQKQQQQPETFAATPQVSSTQEPPNPPSTSTSAYMKFFSPGVFSSMWNPSSQENNHSNHGTPNDEREVGLQPRRTNLPRIDLKKQKEAPMVGLHQMEEPRRFNYDEWSARPQPQSPLQSQSQSQSQSQPQPQAKTEPQPQPQPPQNQQQHVSSLWPTSWGVTQPHRHQYQTANNNHNTSPPEISGHNSIWPPMRITPPPQQHQQQQQQQQPTTFGSGFFSSSTTSMPQQPLQQQTIAQPSAHASKNNVHPPPPPPQQHQQQPLTNAQGWAASNSPRASPGNHLFFDPAATTRKRPVITKGNPTSRTMQTTSSVDDDINQMYGRNTKGADDGVSNFMKKAGLTKITGYNMDNKPDETVGERSGFWADAVQRALQNGRRSPAKGRKKSPKTLSEWLDAPSEHDQPAPVDAKNKEKEKGRKRGGKTSASPPAAAAAAAAAASASGAGAGSGGHTNASKTPRASKAVKAAASKARSRAAVTKSGKGTAKSPTKTGAKGAAKATAKPAVKKAAKPNGKAGAKTRGNTDTKNKKTAKKPTTPKKTPPASKKKPVKKTPVAKKGKNSNKK